jgi:hypothetical protein
MVKSLLLSVCAISIRCRSGPVHVSDLRVRIDVDPFR